MSGWVRGPGHASPATIGLGIAFFLGFIFMSSQLFAGEHAQATSPGKTKEAVGLTVGDRPPPFAANDLNGQPQALATYQGQVVVLHFWASWCPYCRGEIEELVELHARWASKGVKVLTVGLDEDVAVLKQFVTRAALPYPVVADADAPTSIAAQYGVSGIPVTYVLTREGHIASRLDGSADIRGAVQHALDQPPPA